VFGEHKGIPGTAAVLHDPKTISAPLDRTDYSFVSFLEKGRRRKEDLLVGASPSFLEGVCYPFGSLTRGDAPPIFKGKTVRVSEFSNDSAEFSK